MPPLIIIAPPRSRASLLKRLLAGTPECQLISAPGGVGHYGDSLSIQSRTGWEAAAPLWSWVLESWPDAKILFLARDQGAIEARMAASQSRYKWIPKWGKCVGCCGRQVRAMLECFEHFHDLNPTRTRIIHSDDLLNYESAAAALDGFGLSRETWEREIAIVTHPTREVLPDTDPAVDPFHPHATLATLEGLPGGTQLSADVEKLTVTACCRVSIREADIFRFWVSHYQPNTDLMCVIIVKEPGDDITQLEEFCRESAVIYEILSVPAFDNEATIDALRDLVNRHPSGWVLHADSDEMLEGIGEIRTIIENMESAGNDHAMAIMRDRITDDGSLPGLDGLKTTDDLLSAFPHHAYVTRDIARAADMKCFLSRWPYVCQHTPDQALTSRPAKRRVLDHYKWRDGLSSRLQKRVRDHAIAGLPWGIESKRLLDNIASQGKIDVVTHPAPWMATKPNANADPFADNATVEDLEKLPGPLRPDYKAMEAETTRRFIHEMPSQHRFITGKVAVYTLRYGEADWIEECAPTLDNWCERHGYSLAVWGKPDGYLPDEKFATVGMIREFLSGDSDWMIFVDGDVAIHPSAPAWPLLPGFAAAHDKPMNLKHWANWLRRFAPSLPSAGWTYRNSGVWSLDRESARIFLNQVEATPQWQPGVREQHQFNAWMIYASHRGMKVPILPAEWNMLAKYQADTPAWFYHLAGKSELKTRYLNRLRARQYFPRRPREFQMVEPLSERAIVWPWLESLAEWDELKYSMRSVEKFFTDKDCPLYILGDTPPPWLIPGGRVKFLSMDGYSRSNAEGMFQARVTGYQIAEKVLWMNDDIFLLREQGWDDFAVALHEGEVTGRIQEMLEDGSIYKRWMGEAFTDLIHHGMRRVRRFATHTPVCYEIGKVREIFQKFHIHHKGSFANLYHNWHRSPFRRVGPDKARSLPAPPEARFFCHGNFLPGEATRFELESMFPEAPTWEDLAQKPPPPIQ